MWETVKEFFKSESEGVPTMPFTPVEMWHYEQAEKQETRSQQNADNGRRLLTAINTGGIALIFLVAGKLVGRIDSFSWTIAPIIFFVPGLVCIFFSTQYAKKRALVRKRAFEDGQRRIEFKCWERSTLWDALSLMLFLIGVCVSLLIFACLNIPS